MDDELGRMGKEPVCSVLKYDILKSTIEYRTMHCICSVNWLSAIDLYLKLINIETTEECRA